MASERERFSDQIRRAIDESGMSRYRICALIDLDKSVMSRFMAGNAVAEAQFLVQQHEGGLGVGAQLAGAGAGGASEVCSG